MDLHHVKAGLNGKFRRFAEGVGDLCDLFLRQARDVGGHLLVQKGPQLLHGDALGEHAGDILQHGFHVGIGLVELCAELAALTMYRVRQSFIKGKSLFGVQGGAKAVGEYRHVAHDDHGAAAGGDPAQALDLLGLGKPQTGGGENDAVF